MGPNGSGKTTLLRVLLGEIPPDAGTVQRGHLVEFGYYDQHLQLLPDDKPVHPCRSGRNPTRKSTEQGCAICWADSV